MGWLDFIRASAVGWGGIGWLMGDGEPESLFVRMFGTYRVVRCYDTTNSPMGVLGIHLSP